MNWLKWGSLICLMVALDAVSASGQSANFDSLTLGSGKKAGVLSGSTGGSTSLPAIVSNRDHNNNTCLGFGDPNPDHILTLQENFSSLKLRVNSGIDTTLVVQGPNGVVRCGDSTGSSKDASITDTDWQAGSYKIWVGTATPGLRRDYTLSVRQ